MLTPTNFSGVAAFTGIGKAGLPGDHNSRLSLSSPKYPSRVVFTVRILKLLIVDFKLLILGGVGAAVGVWFFAHRHGQLRGIVDATKVAKIPESPGKSPDNV